MDELGLESNPGMSLLSSFSLSELVAGLIFGIIGIWLWRRARRQTHVPHMWIAAGLMAYGFFIHGVYLPWVVGLGLCGAAYYYEHNYVG